MRSPFILLAAATLLLATGARAQDAQLAAAPTCAEQGMQRVALTVPPGRTQDEVRELPRTGALAPAGTEVFILPRGHLTRMKNEEELDRELVRTCRDAAYEPYVINGCRVRAYVRVPFAFSSDYNLTRREIEVKPVRP